MLNVLSRDEETLCLLLELTQDKERERGVFSLVSACLSLLLARRKQKERSVLSHVGWLVQLLRGEELPREATGENGMKYSH